MGQMVWLGQKGDDAQSWENKHSLQRLGEAQEGGEMEPGSGKM